MGVDLVSEFGWAGEGDAGRGGVGEWGGWGQWGGVEGLRTPYVFSDDPDFLR